MEKTKSLFYRALETARLMLPKRYLQRWAFPAAAAMLLACGLPFNAVLYSSSSAPMLPAAALAFCCACRCSLGVQSYFSALLGLCAGSAASGTYSGCIASAFMLGFELIFGAVRGKRGVNALMKYAALFLSGLLALPTAALLGLWKAPSVSGFIEHVLICSLTVSLAGFLACGAAFAAPSPLKRKTIASAEVRILSLALLGGLVSASFAHVRVFGIELGMAAAAFCCLASAQSCGLSAIACAAVVSSVRVFALGSDMLLIAVLCVCSLLAVMLRPLGKWGVLAGFSVPSLALFYFLGGAGSPSPAELILSAAAFLLADGGAAELDASSTREAELERELDKRSRRLGMLSEVLFEMSRLFDGADNGASGLVNMQLSGVAKSLARLALPEAEQRESYSIGIGTAERAGRAGSQTGDAACIRELDGLCLAAISDGMGMGAAARRESEQTVNMVADLVCCGFDIDSAAELVNRLLLLREGGESYATLDALVFDRRKGSAIAAKHGAPASYIVRHGRANAICAEALPVGIVEEARTAVFSLKLKRGDVIIMMSDGVSDALGEELDSAIVKTARKSDPKAAAAELVECARSMGGEDDMTAIVARVS